MKLSDRAPRKGYIETYNDLAFGNYNITMKNEFVENKIFCCLGFQHGIEAAGQRGIATLVHRTPIGIVFLLQSRGIALEDVSKVHPTTGAPDIKINVSSEVGLQYCPWCGTRLQELVDASPDAFDDLAEKHKMFYARAVNTNNFSIGNKRSHHR